jgi:hypothetical protein
MLRPISKAIRVPPAVDQAVFPRFSNCSFVLPAFQAGGSLAGKDSMDASSTMSSTSSCGGGSLGSIGAGGVSWGPFSIATPILLSRDSDGICPPPVTGYALVPIPDVAPPCYP